MNKSKIIVNICSQLANLDKTHLASNQYKTISVCTFC